MKRKQAQNYIQECIRDERYMYSYMWIERYKVNQKREMQKTGELCFYGIQLITTGKDTLPVSEKIYQALIITQKKTMNTPFIGFKLKLL